MEERNIVFPAWLEPREERLYVEDELRERGRLSATRQDSRKGVHRMVAWIQVRFRQDLIEQGKKGRAGLLVPPGFCQRGRAVYKEDRARQGSG